VVPFHPKAAPTGTPWGEGNYKRKGKTKLPPTCKIVGRKLPREIVWFKKCGKKGTIIPGKDLNKKNISLMAVEKAARSHQETCTGDPTEVRKKTEVCYQKTR